MNYEKKFLLSRIIMDVLNNALGAVDGVMAGLRANPYASSAIYLFLILYAGLAAPALPASIAGLFEHSLFKLFILVLMLMLLRNQDITTALLVAVCFTVSLNTLSKYRVFTMANDLQKAAAPATAHASYTGGPVPPDATGDSRGPNGLMVDDVMGDTEYQSDGTNHRIKLRGHRYASSDEANLLPGGHGTYDANQSVTAAASMFPDGKTDFGIGPTGYDGSQMATIGGPDSQL